MLFIRIAVLAIATYSSLAALTKVEEHHNFQQVWTDKGSGNFHDVSIWRTLGEGGVSVGDIVMASHHKPAVGYLVASNSGDISTPSDYHNIWTNAGSGADEKVTIWRVICNQEYVALGDVATTNGEKPSRGTVYCVRESLTTNTDGLFEHLWSNSWFGGADKDVEIFNVKNGPFTFIAMPEDSKIFPESYNI